ncbi:nitroreductase/quinone reductase family protein [Umezawaea beigongshangensis]|uniref:nitroreductase/quinone reductase family protein n=1 Tax=Umezawaea beigongshangensis TaxID=2780383 RepID=UPI0018F142A6|nr:nitroreductase/quinone reductase family protein [Umezawaea beigongshangensis]
MTERETTAPQEFDVDAFQRGVIEEFRANGGRVGGMFAGATLALLTTTGARTGLRRTSPLGYVVIDGQPLVVASAMGAPTHPAWYHNIRRDPLVTVETGTETFEAMAAIPTGAERDALFAKIAEVQPGYAEYQTRTSRVIPVVSLHRIDPDAEGPGAFLVEVHDWLRGELAELRRRADEVLDGRGTAGSDLVRELRAHCATFCGALTKHHTGEDVGAFPVLAQRFPALAPVLTKLGEDHVVVARLQDEIQRLVDGHVPGKDDPAALRRELDRLTAELEAHFAHEERTIVTALNTLAPPPA